MQSLLVFFFFLFPVVAPTQQNPKYRAGRGGTPIKDLATYNVQKESKEEGMTHTHTCVHKKKSLKSVIHSGGGRGCLQYVTSLCCRSPSYFFPSEFRLLPSNRSVLLGSLVYVYIFSSFLYVAFCFYCMYVYIVEKSEKNGKIHYKFNVVSLDKRTRAWKPD